MLKLDNKKTKSAALALVVGVGVAIGGSIGNTLVGILLMMPIGIALIKERSSS